MCMPQHTIDEAASRPGNSCIFKCRVFWDKALVGPSTIYIRISRLNKLGPGDCPSICIFCRDLMGPQSFCCRLPCGHTFHLACIGTWFLAEDASCPLCRRLFYDSRRSREARVLDTCSTTNERIVSTASLFSVARLSGWFSKVVGGLETIL